MIHKTTRHITVLDLIWTNKERLVNEIRVDDNLGAGDYNIIIFNLNV